MTLAGRTINSVHAEYSFVAFRLDNDDIIGFAVEEVSVGRWFEVFPLCLHEPGGSYPFIWAELSAPFTVVSSELLWREEWLEPASDNAGFLGTGPGFTQHAAALGTAPAENGNIVKVLAGIKLIGLEGAQFVVCSSHNTPFKTDLAMDIVEVGNIVRFHTCV
ncbi:hypothetical protein [Duganella callida]|uniref:hypothetical protein n=1 Tax=Duganella callida TaxID=2561932 RepID=UPI00142F9438|nr:hypothetical protein [Duganella callida]